MHLPIKDSILGVTSVLGALAVAIALIPNDPHPIGAMFWPALCLTIGLLAVPVLRMRATMISVLRAENFLMLGLIYWLLLDMLSSAYSLDLVTYDSVITALIA